MRLSKFQEKYDYLKEKNFLQFMASSPDATIPPAFYEVVFADAFYCIAKNHMWVDNNLFKEILTNYLHCEYFLAEDSCRSMIAEIRQKLAPTAAPSCFLDDRDLISFILVSLSLFELPEVERRFGFGTYFFSTVKKSSQTIEDVMTNNKTSGVFVSEDLAKISDALLSLGEERQRNPYLYELKFLYYVLNSSSPEYLLTEADIGEIILFLDQLADSQRTVSKQKIKSLTKQLSWNEQKSKLVLKALCDHEILVPVNLGSKDSWQLGREGLLLMAPSFAEKFWQQGGSCQALVKLNHHFQAACVQKMPDDKLMEIVPVASSLSPAALNRWSQRLENQLPRERLSEIYENVFDKLPFSWQKKAGEGLTR